MSEEKNNADKCKDEFNEILKKYNCRCIVRYMTTSENEHAFQIDFVEQEKK